MVDCERNVLRSEVRRQPVLLGDIAKSLQKVENSLFVDPHVLNDLVQVDCITGRSFISSLRRDEVR